MATRSDVLVIGGAGVDTIVRVPSLPLAREDTLPVPPIHEYVGHTGHGVVRGCHALGLRCAFADVIGDDAQGQMVRDSFAESGIPAAFATTRAGTRRSVNLVDPEGRRQSLHDARPLPDGEVITPSLYSAAIPQARHVHVSIVDWARRAVAQAREAGTPVSTDLHDWDGDDPYHRDFALGAALVFMSASRVADRADDVAQRILRDGRAEAVVTLHGAEGCRISLPGVPVVAIPAVSIPGRDIVDTNGAGDSFVAAFLYARLRGLSWRDAGRAGCIAGAYASGTPGTHTSFIDAAQLDAELARTARSDGRR